MDEPTEVRNFVAGRWIRPAGIRPSDVWNPATGAVNDRAQPLFQQTRSASSARPRPCASRRLGAGLDDARRDRVEALIAAGVTDGATVLVDGRKAGVAEQDDGFFVGATVLDHVAPDMVLTQTKVVVERWS